MFIEYIHAHSHKFITRFNTYMKNHYIAFSFHGNFQGNYYGFDIKDSGYNDGYSIAKIKFLYTDDDLYISSLDVDDDYQGQSIGTFLILLALQIVYEYTNTVGLSGMKISVRLDDMSHAARKNHNIYKHSGLHYEKKDTNEPEMSSCLIHTIRICANFFRWKIKSVINTNKTIFNIDVVKIKYFSV